MSTSIAIMTDIHGNSAALQAVLRDIDENQEIKHIYCLGDMVGIGYQTNEVLEQLFSRDDLSFVSGNHEQEFIDMVDGKKTNDHSAERKHYEWLVSRMDKFFIPFLKALPKQVKAEYHGKELLFTHYPTDNKGEFLPIVYHLSAEKLDSLYQHTSFDVICFGHHHPVHYIKSKQRLYLNPGSLGCHTQPLARYAVVTIDEEIEVELKEIPYPNQDFLKGYHRLNVPDKEFILKAFHGSQYVGRK